MKTNFSAKPRNHWLARERVAILRTHQLAAEIDPEGQLDYSEVDFEICKLLEAEGLPIPYHRTEAIAMLNEAAACPDARHIMGNFPSYEVENLRIEVERLPRLLMRDQQYADLMDASPICLSGFSGSGLLRYLFDEESMVVLASDPSSVLNRLCEVSLEVPAPNSMRYFWPMPVKPGAANLDISIGGGPYRDGLVSEWRYAACSVKTAEATSLPPPSRHHPARSGGCSYCRRDRLCDGDLQTQRVQRK